MKKMYLSFSLAVVSLLAYSQAIPPKQVTDAFGTKFTAAEKVVWSQESINEWEAEFVSSGIDKSANFSSTGEWLETESAVCKKDLPAEIFKTLAIVFEGFELEEYESIEKPGFTGFDITLEKGGTEVEIEASADGTFTLSSIKVEEDDDELCGKGMMMEEGCKGMMEGCCKGMMEGCCKGMMKESCKGEKEDDKEDDKDKDND